MHIFMGKKKSNYTISSHLPNSKTGLDFVKNN